MILADVALRCTRSGIHELGHRGDKLCRREWLGQKDAVGNALRGPLVGMSAGHVDDRKPRVDFSRLPPDFPTIHPAAKTDVGHECDISGLAALQQGHCLFARRCNGRFKTGIAKSLFNQALNGLVVFNNQNEKWFFQGRKLPYCQHEFITRDARISSARYVQKSTERIPYNTISAWSRRIRLPTTP
jgi:hypothetical protein